MRKAPKSFDEEAAVATLEEKNEEIDQQIEIISQGLTELKSIAVDINTNLKQQSSLIEDVGIKTDDTNIKFESANKRLKRFLEENSFNPCLCCIILFLFLILIGIVGYILSII